MANLLAKGAAWLAQQREQHASTLVEIVRRGGGSGALQGMRGRTEAVVDRGEGYVETHRQFDWLFSPDDYRFGGAEPVLPEAGDLVRERTPTHVLTYEATPLPGQAVYRLSDGYGHTLRVHCKLIKREAL